jgi:hypothetical protein
MRKLVFSGILFSLLVFFAGLAAASQVDLEKSLIKAVEKSRSIVEKAIADLQQDKSVLTEVKQLQKELDGLLASDMLMKERMQRQNAKAVVLGGKALERQRAQTDRYDAAMAPLIQALQNLPANGNASLSALNEIIRLIDRVLPEKRHYPIYGTVPYRHLSLAPQTPVSTPTVIPAYRSSSTTSTSADHQGVPEGEISAAIAAKAEELEWSPVKIYEWVKNNIETEWYWGCMKGAEQTLLQGSGNDADQAALLVAMLRASGYPARYVRGVIEFFPEDMAKIANLIGVEDSSRFDVFFQQEGLP